MCVRADENAKVKFVRRLGSKSRGWHTRLRQEVQASRFNGEHGHDSVNAEACFSHRKE